MVEKKVAEKMFNLACQVRKRAYSPYSNFKVGASILTDSGKIFTGCNVENSSYGLTVCAERIAIFKAVSEGYDDFLALMIVTDRQPPVSPCGACRQVLAEFAPEGELEIIMANLAGEKKTTKFSQLFPAPFGEENIK